MTPWSVAHQAPLSMGFPRQEYWSGLPFSSPGVFPHSGIKPESAALADGFSISELSGKSLMCVSGGWHFSRSDLFMVRSSPGLFPDSILEAKFER